MAEVKLVFITGAHGVGKSTICKKSSLSIEVDYFKASELICSHLNRTLPMNKQTVNITELFLNQYALVEEVLYLRKSSHRTILLEGHTCLINRDLHIQQIPMEIFCLLDISAIVIVTRRIDEISKSIFLRDHISYSSGIVQCLQDLEISTAKLISKEFSIPLLHIDTSNKDVRNLEILSKNAKQLEEFLISV